MALIPSRSRRDDMRLLGHRIDVSQADEINMMKHWLQVRGQQVPNRTGFPVFPCAMRQIFG